jgi:hypothetical protein
MRSEVVIAGQDHARDPAAKAAFQFVEQVETVHAAVEMAIGNEQVRGWSAMREISSAPDRATSTLQSQARRMRT